MARAKSKTGSECERAPASPERRRFVRKLVLWSGSVDAAEMPVDCAVLDVSLQGARVRVNQGSLPQGPTSIAVSRFGTFQAEVVWTKDQVSGLRFLESIERIAETIGRQLPLAMVA